MATIDYYLSLQSPWTYLGHQRIVRYAKESGSELNIYPLNFGEVFASTGGLPLPKRAPERQAYRLLEIARWSKALDTPMNIEPRHFPANDRLAGLCTVALRESGEKSKEGLSVATEFAGRILSAVWKEELDISEESLVHDILRQCGADVQTTVDAAGSEEIAAKFVSDTQAAIRRGVFGAPSYVVDGELFWGQDRLPFVASRLGVAADQVS